MGRAVSAFSENAINKSKRDPAFEFELDEVLLQFKYQTPHFEPLFQLPDRFATRHRPLLTARIFRIYLSEVIKIVLTIRGGGVPHTPS